MYSKTCSVLYSLLSYLRRIRPNNVYPGSGFFVVYFGIYFFLTCCHNFLIKTKINSIVRTLEDRVLEKKIKWKCKRTVFHCSTKDLKSTVALPASVVLANFRDPVVVCDKVGRVDNLSDLSHVGQHVFYALH